MKRSSLTKMPQWETGAGMPIRLHMRNDLHLVRKTFHMVMGLLIAFIYLSGLSCTMGVMILSCALGVDLLIETTRLRSPSINERVMKVWGPFMRNCEVSKLSGTPYYILAAIFAVGIFPKPVAILSILYLACGDPLASLVGILYGSKSFKIAQGKSLIGTMAGVVTCAFITFIYLKSLNLGDSTVLILTLVGGLAGGTAELLPFDIDDNFTIPVISGFVMWLAFILLGI